MPNRAYQYNFLKNIFLFWIFKKRQSSDSTKRARALIIRGTNRCEVDLLETFHQWGDYNYRINVSILLIHLVIII